MGTGDTEARQTASAHLAPLHPSQLFWHPQRTGASHSTLDDEHIDNGDWSVDEFEWTAGQFRFPISVGEDEQQMAQHARHMRWDGDIEEEEEQDSEALQAACVDLLSTSDDEPLADDQVQRPADELNGDAALAHSAHSHSAHTAQL